MLLKPLRTSAYLKPLLEALRSPALAGQAAGDRDPPFLKPFLNLYDPPQATLPAAGEDQASLAAVVADQATPLHATDGAECNDPYIL